VFRYARRNMLDPMHTFTIWHNNRHVGSGVTYPDGYTHVRWDYGADMAWVTPGEATEALDGYERRTVTSTAQLEHSPTVLTHVHTPDRCAREACTVHARSQHGMRDWPQHWRDDDRTLMERICPHGVGHPDPDSPYPPDSHFWAHGCDGCCR